ncbi:CBASS cGAMP synthase [Acinetobacter sp. ANC 4636]
MTWNFHSYYTNRDTGLIGQLILDDHEKNALKALRQIVRERTRDVFDEAKQLVKSSKQYYSALSFRTEFVGTHFKFLSADDQKTLSELIMDLSDDLKAEFMKISPRFWTQGSFMYDTLNRPYKSTQEMDIDDGTYLPMQFFEDKPAIGHQLLLLLVDASLQSLAFEHSGWAFEAKETCGRINIPAKSVHIDVPMYAIPFEKFIEKEELIRKSAASQIFGEMYDSVSAADHALYDQIETDCVNLAVRKDDAKWIKSDPKDVHLWFQDACQRTGQHLRKVCRILKAWRDAGDWQESNGPSSISLMAAVVDILDRTTVDPKDFGLLMLTVARKLPDAFHNGVESPDENDDRPLFPPYYEHEPKHKEVMQKLEQLVDSLESAYAVHTKQDALDILNGEYGDRVQDLSLIVSQAAAPAYESTPLKAKEAAIISTSMKSG